MPVARLAAPLQSPSVSPWQRLLCGLCLVFGGARLAASSPVIVAGSPMEMEINQVTEHGIECLLRPIETKREQPPRASPGLTVAAETRRLWRGRTLPDRVTLQAGTLAVHLSRTPLSLAVYKANGQLAQRLTWDDRGAIAFRTPAPVFGLGEGGGGFDRRGRVQPLTDGYFAGDDTNRVISPLLLGADGWALFMPDLPDVIAERGQRRAGLQGEFDLRADPGIFRKLPGDDPLRILLICSDSPATIMRELAQLTGRAVLPPRWVLGYLQSHRTLAGWDEVVGVARAFREKQLPWGWNTGSPGIVESPIVPPAEALRDPDVEPICRQYLELRYRLMPYNYSLVREACDTGLPMMRALWLHYPGDPAAIARDDEYLWGREILVAPVLEKGATCRAVYLPPGTWFDWWTGKAYPGARTVDRPVDLATLPLFVRAGPMAASRNSDALLPRPRRHPSWISGEERHEPSRRSMARRPRPPVNDVNSLPAVSHSIHLVHARDDFRDLEIGHRKLGICHWKDSFRPSH